MKAIIPVGGLGTRLRPHTLTRPKTLLYVAGKPILAHILDELVAVGVRQIVLVTGYLGDQVEAWVREHYDVEAHFVEQAEPIGNGHAVYVARHHLDDEPALIVFGDTIVRAQLRALVSRPDSTAAVKEVADPSRFGIAEVDRDGFIRRLVEKPERVTSRLAVIGVYLIRNGPLLRTCLERMVDERRTMRGEYWLADALQLMIDAGERMGTFPIEHWYDCGTVEALLQANRELLTLDPPEVAAPPDVVVLPPSAISPEAHVARAVIGPHASIGPGAVVADAVVRDTIVNPGAVVEHALITGSVIGEGARVTGVASRVNVGDYSTLELG